MSGDLGSVGRKSVLPRQTEKGCDLEGAPFNEATQFRVDLDEEGELDDLSISRPYLVRIERMAGNSFWGRITMEDGREVEFRFWTPKAVIQARVEVTPGEAAE